MTLHKSLCLAKEISRELALMSSRHKNALLRTLLELLRNNKNKILHANTKDVKKAQHGGKDAAFLERLSLSEKHFNQMCQQLNKVIALADPVGEIIEQRTLQNGVNLKKVRVPLGVIGIIYESRPNVTLDVSLLCFKTGNAAVLKCGREAKQSCEELVRIIHQSLMQHGLSPHAVCFVNPDDRRFISSMLRQDKYIDVIIPRGGHGLIQKVISESTIPVLYHAAGGARIYIDESADLDIAVQVCLNAKVNRPAACNSLDTVVVHEGIAKEFLTHLAHALLPFHVELRGDARARRIIDAKVARQSDYKCEFLDFILAIKVVDDIHQAITFIQHHTKAHSEGIVANNEKVIQTFLKRIDAAALFVNCSTRLHDGNVFGLGAEMGISTGRLHARGPVGLRDLTTYKWIAEGKGQVRV